MKKIFFYVTALSLLSISTFTSCGDSDDKTNPETPTGQQQNPNEPNKPDGPGPNENGGGTNQTNNCYIEPSNILLMSDGLAFNWKFGPNTKYYYWESFTQSDYNKLSESEVLSRVVTGKLEDRNTPDNDDFACIYNCNPSTSYVIVTVSYAEGDQRGEMVVTPMSTKSDTNQPVASIDDISYYTGSSTSNYYYGWTTKKNKYCYQYYTYAAASPDYFYSYALLENDYTPMLAWLLRNEIIKNGEDHSTSINDVSSIGWDFNNGRDMFFAAQIESGTTYLRRFPGTDKYFLVVTWAIGANNELSGVFDYTGYTFKDGTSTTISKADIKAQAAKRGIDGPQKMLVNSSNIKLTRLNY